MSEIMLSIVLKKSTDWEPLLLFLDLRFWGNLDKNGKNHILPPGQGLSDPGSANIETHHRSPNRMDSDSTRIPL